MGRRKRESAGPGGGEPGADRRGSPEPGPGAAAPRKGRGRYSEARKAELLAELESSGETLEAFAGRRGVGIATLYAWRRERRSTHRPEVPVAERRKALALLERTGLPRNAFARLWGVTSRTLSTWIRRRAEEGERGLVPRKRGRPRGSAKGPRLAEPVKAAIVETKRLYPDFGLRKLRFHMMRYLGIRVSEGSVHNVLKEKGLPPSKPPARRRKKNVPPKRFERARPREMWQSDITSYLLPRHHTRVYLTVFLDDCSRFVVSWKLSTNQREDLVLEALEMGIASYGPPREVLTDQGRQYATWRGKSAFQKLCAKRGIEHFTSQAHHPETLGKCERLWRTVKEELFDRVLVETVEDARGRLDHFFRHYNFFRPHQGLDGAVPAERFFGTEEEMRRVLGDIQAENELRLALGEPPRRPLFLAGQIDGQAVSISGEKGHVDIQVGEVLKRIEAASLGGPEVREPALPAKEEDRDDRDEHDGGDDGGAQGPAGPAGPAAAAGAIPDAPPAGGGGAGAVGGGERGGEEEGARVGDGNPGVVARGDGEGGGGGEAPGEAAAPVAALADGALGDGGGALEAAGDGAGAAAAGGGGAGGAAAEDRTTGAGTRADAGDGDTAAGNAGLEGRGPCEGASGCSAQGDGGRGGSSGGPRSGRE